MITIKTMPKEALGELLAYLADNESFANVEKKLDGCMTVAEIRAALRELAIEVKREVASEDIGAAELVKGTGVTRKTKEVLTCLSSYEEKKLLSAFGFIEKS